MNQYNQSQLGDPDLKISGLEIWVHGRQFPKIDDYWDGNWLLVTVHCEAEGASIWVNGPIIHLSELNAWLSAVKEMNKSLNGEANLECMEPELGVSIKAESLGNLSMEVYITPNHLTQNHTFKFEIDQSYLPMLINNCQMILSEYPIKGSY